MGGAAQPGGWGGGGGRGGGREGRVKVCLELSELWDAIPE